MAKHKIIIGSVSHGTLRPEDLIPALKAEYAYYAGKAALRRLRLGRPSAAYYSSETASEDLDILIDALNSMAPPYIYFGAHPGDGSDFGFWFDSEAFNEDYRNGEIKEISEVSKDYYQELRGLVCAISDHGNITVYNKIGRDKLVELVSVV